MMKKRSHQNRNLTRIIVEGQRGWQVKIERRGERHEPYFSDSVFGSARKALQAARRARDELDRKYPCYTRLERANLKSKRSKSGVRGVRLVKLERRNGRKMRSYLLAVATWSPKPGEIKRRSFSVTKFGRAKAWELAVKARQQGLRQAAP